MQAPNCRRVIVEGCQEKGKTQNSKRADVVDRGAFCIRSFAAPIRSVLAFRGQADFASCPRLLLQSTSVPCIPPRLITMEAATTTQAGSADLSCVACRRLKRKCSKDRPACSLCHRVGRLCQYPPLTPSSPGSATQSGRYRFPAESPPIDDQRKRRRRQTYGLASLSGDANGSAGPASPTSAPAAVRPRFPAVWYLDSMTAKSMAVSSNSTLQWSDVEGVFVEPSMDEVKSAFREYRDSVHHWLPVGMQTDFY